MDNPSSSGPDCLDGERNRGLWGKALDSLVGKPATVLNLRRGISVHAKGYSEERKNTIREIFDTDIVVPELEKVFSKGLEFYTINADDNREILKRYRLPSVVLFSGGSEVKVLEGIKAWNEYLEALSCL